MMTTLILAVVGGSCGHAERLAEAWVLVDSSASTTELRTSVRHDVLASVHAADGDVIHFARSGGAPGDDLIGDASLACEGSDRQCNDPNAADERIAAAMEVYDEVLATPTVIPGSSPLTTLYRLLDRLRPGDTLDVFTDGYERSDTYQIDDSTELSTVEARAQVIETFASRGYSFQGAPADTTVRLHLLPADAGAESPTRFRQVLVLLDELLNPPGTTNRIDIVPFVPTID
jgi:hypothetical protein